MGNNDNKLATFAVAIFRFMRFSCGARDHLLKTAALLAPCGIYIICGMGMGVGIGSGNGNGHGDVTSVFRPP